MRRGNRVHQSIPSVRSQVEFFFSPTNGIEVHPTDTRLVEIADGGCFNKSVPYDYFGIRSPLPAIALRFRLAIIERYKQEAKNMQTAYLEKLLERYDRRVSSRSLIKRVAAAVFGSDRIWVYRETLAQKKDDDGGR